MQPSSGSAPVPGRRLVPAALLAVVAVATLSAAAALFLLAGDRGSVRLAGYIVSTETTNGTPVVIVSDRQGEPLGIVHSGNGLYRAMAQAAQATVTRCEFDSPPAGFEQLDYRQPIIVIGRRTEKPDVLQHCRIVKQ